MDDITKQAMWLAKREAYLKAHGLVECEDCKSWVYNNRYNINFHYRRCEG